MICGQVHCIDMAMENLIAHVIKLYLQRILYHTVAMQEEIQSNINGRMHNTASTRFQYGSSKLFVNIL